MGGRRPPEGAAGGSEGRARLEGARRGAEEEEEEEGARCRPAPQWLADWTAASPLRGALLRRSGRREPPATDPATAGSATWTPPAMNGSWEEDGAAGLSGGGKPSSAATASSAPPGQVVAEGSPRFWDSGLNQGLSVFVALALGATMLGLGCTVEVSQLGAQLRRPLGLLLALLCQFGLMPLVAFLLALVFALDEVAAVAVLLCGCCPGGNLSNIMSLLVDGDMNLR